MADRFEYRVVTYDTVNHPVNETVAQGVSNLLNANGREGWELMYYEDDVNHIRYFWMKRRTSN